MNLLAIKSTFENNIAPLLSKLFSPVAIANVATKMPLILNQKITEKLLNAAFSEQIQDGDFDFLIEQQLQIELIDAKLFIGVSFNQGQINCSHFSAETFSADATLSINTYDAIGLTQQQIDPDTLFFQRKLKIRGDTELAHHVKNTIDTLDPKIIPEFLLKLIGLYKQRILQPAL
jgi:predicted lipid carrier protein YhbT